MRRRAGGGRGFAFGKVSLSSLGLVVGDPESPPSETDDGASHIVLSLSFPHPFMPEKQGNHNANLDSAAAEGSFSPCTQRARREPSSIPPPPRVWAGQIEMLLLYNVREARHSSSSSPQSWLLVRRERSYVWRAAKDVVFAFLFSPFSTPAFLHRHKDKGRPGGKKVTEKENCPLPAASFLITAKQTVRPSAFRCRTLLHQWNAGFGRRRRSEESCPLSPRVLASRAKAQTEHE